ncbi:ABC transporter transmembrane domain-containing protein [Arthrobacter sp. H14]|uniref:ABC transporter transmembrane domain-containing protein n=1 Tax=Arthrobacter sp. H14 TaxID=1312959 RepID=UPI0006880C4D|nr:ABC transporter ATP-binding protein [Arthrobacter sp. H14]
MLPKLLTGRRRWYMAMLIVCGLALAAAAGASALLMTRALSSGGGTTAFILILAGLLIAALGTGALRAVERVLAEKLGQHYIHQIRTGLIRSALSTDRGPAAGITIARTTNDLTSVRNWVAQGIAPLAVGIPLVLGTLCALWLLAPPLALAVVVPLCLLAGTLALLAIPAFRRARILRRKRGQLAAHIADTVAAAQMIRIDGGLVREVKKVDKLGGSVAGAAIDRATIAGYIRGSAAAVAALALAAVATVGAWQAVPTATIAGALTIVGMIATPVADMGKVVEYRQNFKAARRILGPALVVATPTPKASEAQPGSADVNEAGSEGLHVSGITIDGGAELPPLEARPGDRIVLRAADPAQATGVLERMLGVRPDASVRTLIDGVDLLSAEDRDRRVLVGYAAAGSLLERGTIGRSVRYRRPELHVDEGSAALDKAGLGSALANLPEGERTRLKRGGEPLTVSEQARLKVARAALGEPPLLVLNRVDGDLDDDGRVMLAGLLQTYPGIVVLAPATMELAEIDGGRPWWVDRPDLDAETPRSKDRGVPAGPA